MIGIKIKQLKKLEKNLNVFNLKALPFATRNTINQAAFKTQKLAKQNIKDKMTLRNKFTVSSVRVNQSKSLNISKQQSETGTIADYLVKQEFGEIIQKSGKHGVPIATSYAAGQSETAKRTKLVRKPNKLQSLQLKRKAKGANSRKQRNFIAIQQAVKSSNKYVFLELGRTKGIFKVVGGKRKPRIKMVWSLKQQSITVNKNPWLEPAFNEVIKEMPAMYLKSLLFQVKKQKLFRNK